MELTPNTQNMSTLNLQLPIALGADHAGFAHKQTLIEYLTQNNIPFKDFGCYNTDSMDYPDVAHPVALAVESGAYSCGILLCGSANGVALTANKHQGIRAGLAWVNEVAQLIRQHNNANIVCIPARFVTIAQATQILQTFLHTPFEGGRHQTRVNKISC
jgi:ribose 5-phosphate isomerase B